MTGAAPLLDSFSHRDCAHSDLPTPTHPHTRTHAHANTAFLIAIARTVTYHHRFEDIAVGLFIGTGCAVVAFHGQPKTLTHVPHYCDDDERGRRAAGAGRFRRGGAASELMNSV